MKKLVKKEIEEIIETLELFCSVDDFIIEANDPIYKIPIEEVPSMEGKDRVCLNTMLWSDLCHKYSLSEDFMREFINHLHWPHMSAHQNMSLKFIRDFKHLIHWYWHIRNVDFSFDFILEFEGYIDMDFMISEKPSWKKHSNEDFSMEEYNRYKEKCKIHNRFEILDL